MIVKVIEVTPFIMSKPVETDSYLRLTFKTREGDKELSIRRTKKDICNKLGVDDENCDEYNFTMLINKEIEISTSDHFLYKFVRLID